MWRGCIVVRLPVVSQINLTTYFFISGECAAQKLKKTFAVLVYGHVYIIWSY